MTPMEPTRALGMAMMREAGQLNRYAPDAPTPRMKETTGFFLAKDVTAR